MLSPNNDLHTIQRELEIITEALESLEGIASSNDIPSKQIGDVMTPLCLNLGVVIDKLSTHQNKVGERIDSDFTGEHQTSLKIGNVVTNRDEVREILTSCEKEDFDMP